ncbi:MAG: nuclear transport factor 2 family protein [Myxococcales bacterium]|nr:nuclear transport factor 2 family protein [Myxococcales bacterium]
MDPIERAVLDVNQAYYDAFLARDADAMERIWALSAPVACMHPGLAPIVGRAEVMRSFRGIFAHPEAPSIVCSQARAHVLGTSAYVTCLEGTRGEAPRLAATNVFTLENGRWRLVHHQAGPLTAPYPAPARKRPAKPSELN